MPIGQEQQDDSFDGIDKTILAQMIGISSLTFNDWFKTSKDEPNLIVANLITKIGGI